MVVFPPCMVVIGVFFLIVGVNGIVTKSFSTTTPEGRPSVILGSLCVGAAVILCGAAAWMWWMIQIHGNMGGM